MAKLHSPRKILAHAAKCPAAIEMADKRMSALHRKCPLHHQNRRKYAKFHIAGMPERNE